MSPFGELFFTILIYRKDIPFFNPLFKKAKLQQSSYLRYEDC